MAVEKQGTQRLQIRDISVFALTWEKVVVACGPQAEITKLRKAVDDGYTITIFSHPGLPELAAANSARRRRFRSDAHGILATPPFVAVLVRYLLMSMAIAAATCVWIRRDFRYILKGRSGTGDYNWVQLVAIAMASILITLVVQTAWRRLAERVFTAS